MTQSRVPAVDTALFGNYRATYQREAERLMTDLTAGRITVDEWQAAMLKEIGYLILIAYAAGKGGLKALTDADRAIIERKTAEQARYIRRWAEQLRQQADSASGTLVTGPATAGTLAAGIAASVWKAGMPLTVAGLVGRALLYIESALAVVQIGHSMAMDLPLLPAYPKDGTTQCLIRCYCHWDIVHLGGKDWDCTWVLDPNRENCPQCIRRAARWRPLQVRRGVIQPYSPVGLFAA